MGLGERGSIESENPYADLDHLVGSRSYNVAPLNTQFDGQNDLLRSEALSDSKKYQVKIFSARAKVFTALVSLLSATIVGITTYIATAAISATSNPYVSQEPAGAPTYPPPPEIVRVLCTQ